MGGYIGKGQAVALLDTTGIATEAYVDSEINTVNTALATKASQDDVTTALSGISSDALTKSFPVASGASISALDVVHVSPDGTVGNFPLVNAIGSTTSAATSSLYTVTNADATKALIVTNTGDGGTSWLNFQAVLKGTDGVETLGGTYSKGRSSYGGGYWNVFPLTSSKFGVVHAVSSQAYNADYSTRQQAGLQCYMIEVSDSGAISLISNVIEFGLGYNYSGTYSSGGGFYNGEVSSGVHLVTAYVNSGSPAYQYSITMNSNTNSISYASDTEARNWTFSYGNNRAGHVLMLNSGTRLLACSGTTVYTATFSGNNIAAYSTYTMTFPLYGNSSTWWKVGPARMIHYYNDTLGAKRYASVSFDDAGNYTVDDVGYITTEQFGSTSTPTDLRSNGSTGIVTILNANVCAFQLNADGTFVKDEFDNIKTVAVPALPNYVSNSRFAFRDSNTVVVEYTDVNGKQTIPVTINGYSNPYGDKAIVGIAKDSAASGSVDIVVHGVVSGFTGLTPQSIYYVSPLNDGSLTTVSNDYPVGRAISSTELLLIN